MKSVKQTITKTIVKMPKNIGRPRIHHEIQTTIPEGTSRKERLKIYNRNYEIRKRQRNEDDPKSQNDPKSAVDRDPKSLDDPKIARHHD